MSPEKKRKIIFISVIAVLVLAIVVSAAYLFSYYSGAAKQRQQNAALQQMKAEATTEEATVPEETEPTETTGPRNEVMLAEYKKLHDDIDDGNEDIVGWLKIEGTEIDYPVMRSAVDKPDFYLYRDWNKNDSVRGSIYIHEDVDPFTPDDNVTMFGHNMRDGTMFACLKDYQDKKAWEKNSLITFDTLYEYHTYKIFAVFKTTASVNQGFAYHKFTNAKDATEFDAFIKECRKNAFYDTGIIPAYGDKIICLSTCEYTLENGRLVVAAVQIS